jgi:hypothetical protein
VARTPAPVSFWPPSSVFGGWCPLAPSWWGAAAVSGLAVGDSCSDIIGDIAWMVELEPAVRQWLDGLSVVSFATVAPHIERLEEWAIRRCVNEGHTHDEEED